MLHHDIRCNVPDLLDDVGIATQIRPTKKNMDVARASMDAARAGHSMDVARILPGLAIREPNHVGSSNFENSTLFVK